ncbi:ClpP family protease [Prescottella sp. R16]|uniref:ClpP family protease n=1 Tax=Prescottella sp. R16 TaxID=3064529 RepID=UPI00272DC83A|nr:ATP-dependent Clp protease proteolytic subunit [Prescottella sp. R16]
MSENTIDPTAVLDRDLNQRLFAQRMILLGDALEQANTNRICTALLVLATEDPDSDIALVINSPGGSVPGMLAIRDCMRAVPNDVATVNLGMAYSAGQFLLSAGTPGKRVALPHAKVLLHQGSGGVSGSAPDVAIQADQIRHTRDTVLACIAEDTGRTVEQITRDSVRDRWFTAGEALDYGFVDRVVTSLDDVVPRPLPRSFGLGVAR